MTTSLTSEIVGESLDLLLSRVRHLHESHSETFPLYVESGDNWFTTQDGNWCAGYWVGLLALAAAHATDEAGRKALEGAALSASDKMTSQDLDNIFAGLNHYGCGIFAARILDNPELKRLGIKGAEAMSSLYNPRAQQIPIGRFLVEPRLEGSDGVAPDLHHIAAVDVVHTSVPILFQAHLETGDRRYLEIAKSHADRHIEWFVREDGSTVQLAEFDEQGNPVQWLNPLADSPDGCWSRGLAWSIAGLATALIATGESRYGEALRRCTTYFMEHSESGIPDWDHTLGSGKPSEWDSSAAAIAAWGLVQAGRSDVEGAADYARAGHTIVSSLIDRCLVTEGPRAGALDHGCYWAPQGVGIDTETIWGTFYLAATLDSLLSDSS